MMISQWLYNHRIFKRLAKALIRLRQCAGLSDALLVVHTTLLEISSRDSFNCTFFVMQSARFGREKERADCFNFFQIHSSVKGLYALKTSCFSLKLHGFVCDCGMSSFWNILIYARVETLKTAIRSESCLYQDAGVSGV